MNVKGYLAALCVGLFALGPARAADLPGAKDPPYLKRYEGSQIVHYLTRPYDSYILFNDAYIIVGAATATGSEKHSEAVEGAVTRIWYAVPPGHTALELVRNYQQMLTEAGFAVGQPLALTNIPSNIYGIYNQLDKFFLTPMSNARTLYYLRAKGTKDGLDLSIATTFSEPPALSWTEQGVKAPIVMPAGSVLVTVDIVAAKAVENKMVEVKATDMADALATKGSIDIYGILFDTDKTDIKPDSKKTLDEVATLLKIDRSLKLEIAGHTDNTGTPEHNAALSEGRAKAVVDALVKNYGIDAARLQPRGYGETKPVAPNTDEAGRAKNRRVELRKI